MPRRTRGTGTLRRRKDGKWEGRYRDRDGRLRSVYGSTRAEASEKLDAGLSVTGAIEGLTLGDWLDVWLELERPRLRPRSYDTYEGMIRTNINPRIGSIRLAAIRPSDIERLTALMIGDGKSKRTAALARSILSSAFRFAENDGLIDRNPVRASRAPRLPPAKRLVLSREQIRSMFDALQGDPLMPMYLLAVQVGMRDAELRGLQWSDVDLDSGTIHVRNQLQYRDGKLTLVPTKTDHSQRTIRIGEGLAGVLRAHRGSSGFVFTRNDAGDPVTPTLRREHWKALRRKIGYEGSFHSLRGTAATLMIEAGVSARTVQQILGHSDVHTTLALYVQPTPVSMDEAAALMDSVVSVSGTAR